MDNQENCLDQYKKYGICPHYIDAWGAHKTVKLENLDALKNALENQTIKKNSASSSELSAILSPVYVYKEADFIHITINFTHEKSSFIESLKTGSAKWTLKNDHKKICEGTLSQQDLEQLCKEKKITLNLSYKSSAILEMGYYDFNICFSSESDQKNLEKKTASTCIIIAPRQCFQSESFLNDKKLWGTSVQLYTLRSNKNWGIGDFSDLKRLISYLANIGADYVALNPLHSLFPEKPEDASPYSPSSRHWLNFIYLDVEEVDGFQESESAKAYVSSAAFQQTLEQLRNEKYVNYTAVSHIKYQALRLIHKDLIDNKNLHTLRQEFKFFKQQNPKLSAHAFFEALHDTSAVFEQSTEFGDWDDFLKKYPSPSLYENTLLAEFTSNKKNEELIDFYHFLQWQTDKQLKNVHLHAIKQCNMKIGLFRDLAIGVNAQSSDVWSNPSIYCSQASIGAPPDVLNYQGQDWGLPPMLPQSLQNHQYQPFIELLRSNMKNCGALRIDHILGLLRLWWIPKNAEASEGAYVEYPIDDLIAILALESHRNQCTIIGEDLGTIPEIITQKLADASILSYKVFFFYTAPDGGFYSPHDYPYQSLATLCTHDMPTLQGYWHCKDIEMGKALNLHLDLDQSNRLYEGRFIAKQRILDSMRWHGSLSNTDPNNDPLHSMNLTLNQDLHRHIAKTNSYLLSFQLEDWLQMEDPVNVPGTSNEYPNWRRKLSWNLEDIFENQDLKHFLQQISMLRQQCSSS